MLENLLSLVSVAHKKSREEFRAMFDHPVFIVQPFNTGETKFQTVSHAAGDGTSVALARIQKRPGANAFAMMVTVGRAGNNDIEIRAPDVSKFHAYLRELGGSWTITDAGSRFGTYVDGQQVGRDTPSPLRPGAEVKLGSVQLVFHDADSLHQYLIDDL